MSLGIRIALPSALAIPPLLIVRETFDDILARLVMPRIWSSDQPSSSALEILGRKLSVRAGKSPSASHGLLSDQPNSTTSHLPIRYKPNARAVETSPDDPEPRTRTRLSSIPPRVRRIKRLDHRGCGSRPRSTGVPPRWKCQDEQPTDA